MSQYKTPIPACPQNTVLEKGKIAQPNHMQKSAKNTMKINWKSVLFFSFSYDFSSFKNMPSV